MIRLEGIRAGDLMTKDLIAARPGDTVSEAIMLMQRHGISEVPVVQDGKVVGMVSDETFMKKRHLPLSARLEYVMTTPPAVMETDSVIDACVMLLSSGYRGLPVLSEKGHYTGFISRSDIVRKIPEMEDLKGMAVGEIMTPDPSTIKEHETMEQARVMMWRMDVRVLPVVDQVGRLSGMIGIKDIVKLSLNPPATETRGEFIGEKDADVEDLEVRSLMVEPPITTSPDEDLQEAARKISENDISALVVLEDGEIKGILTQIDLIELIASLREVDQAYVQITGLEEGLDVIWAMHGSIQKYLQLFGQIIRPRVMNVHVVPYHRGGRETKYSLKLRLQTDKGMFFAKNHGWNLIQVLDEALETLRREIIHEKEKRLERVKEASRR